MNESALSSEPTRHGESLRPRRDLSRRWSALIAIVTFVLVVCVVGGFVAFVSSPTWLELYRMHHHGRETVAKVTRVDLANHRSCQFHYTVASTDYSSTESCDAIAGAQIRVTYDPQDPTQVTAGDPGSELETDLIVLLIGAVGFAIGRASCRERVSYHV